MTKKRTRESSAKTQRRPRSISLLAALPRWIAACCLASIALSISPASVHAQDAPATRASTVQLDLVGGVAMIGAPGEVGLAFALGTRLALGRYTALRFDIGYGVLGGSRSLEDRWWLIPSFAVVVPVDRLRVELGVGVGFATSSGYTDFDAFVRDPFEDDWAYQLVPAIRGHAALWAELASDVDAYAQLDAGGLLTAGNDLGLRVGPNDGAGTPSDAQLVWATLTVGTSHRLD
ncbi:MAG: hypothetical protein M3Y87_19165 [Myxococcota bacterium]|nr:hypothetical protein [Myxococcota bacterium]